jgi:hypothetical protein
MKSKGWIFNKKLYDKYISAFKKGRFKEISKISLEGDDLKYFPFYKAEKTAKKNQNKKKG